MSSYPYIEPPHFALVMAKPVRGAGWTGSAVASLLIHALGAGALAYATMQVAEKVVEQAETYYVELVQETTVPELPPPPPLADVPYMGGAPEVKGFQTLAIPDVALIPIEIPPPAAAFEFRAEDFSGEGMLGGRGDGDSTRVAHVAPTIGAEPIFTPFTTPPVLRNREEAAEAIVTRYPRDLRAAGLGGEVMMWFFIDETGAVQDVRVARSSGVPALDEAAADVAPLLTFSPALNRGIEVPVWVQLPIIFNVQMRE